MNGKPVEQRLRSYLQERSDEPFPIGMEHRIVRRTQYGRGRLQPRSWLSQAAGAAALAILAFVVGLSVFYARSHASPASHAPAGRAVPSPTPAPPPGGPAPAELRGQWVTGEVPSTGRLVIRPDSWVSGAVHGELVVRGNEIDFFNADYCGIRLPGGVGRYQWSINGGLLRFTPLAPDPCTGRPASLGSLPFTKVADSG